MATWPPLASLLRRTCEGCLWLEESALNWIRGYERQPAPLVMASLALVLMDGALPLFLTGTVSFEAADEVCVMRRKGVTGLDKHTDGSNIFFKKCFETTSLVFLLCCCFVWLYYSPHRPSARTRKHSDIKRECAAKFYLRRNCSFPS